ncbi:MAG TPA: glycine betaine ABC transporter substrate-binding protein [Burkholderiaceae bacterium]|nr:glycine betaine ABC transporter substrate-binding protein [Burkholderiaceae bacterium]
MTAHLRTVRAPRARFPIAAAAACLVLAVAALLAAAAQASTPRAGDTLRIGSKRFPESYVLAWILSGVAAPAARVEVRAGLGNTAITYEALRTGAIDLYPEYLGTIDREILRGAGGGSRESIAARLAPLGLGIAVPLGFGNGYALAMREADAERLGIRRIGDLARHPTLRAGLSSEFLGRADGWPGLAARYGLAQAPTGLDHALGYAALAEGRIDLMDVYTTDARIGQLGLRVLEDDLGHFPRYDAVLLYRLDVPDRFPDAWARIRRLEGAIDERAMIALNARVELDGVPFETAARDWIAGREVARGARRGFAERLLADDLGPLAVRHLALVVASTLAATLLGVPLGIAVAARPRVRTAALAAVGVLQTVPSLAMLALLIAATGSIGALPAVLALTLYALLPIVRGTALGIAQVPEGLRDAADALALTPAQRLRLVDLPIAMPALLGGIRTAAVIGTGTATIAAFIGAGGFGERIVAGLALNDPALMLAGAVPSAALAVGLELAFEAFERRARRRAGAAR